jgi:hypothetical protein
MDNGGYFLINEKYTFFLKSKDGNFGDIEDLGDLVLAS